MRLFSFIRDLSETISNGMSITAQKSKQLSKQLEYEVTAKCMESELDCKRRVKKAIEKMHEEELNNININEIYEQIYKRKEKNL